jgi:hypothetical protein
MMSCGQNVVCSCRKIAHIRKKKDVQLAAHHSFRLLPEHLPQPIQLWQMHALLTKGTHTTPACACSNPDDETSLLVSAESALPLQREWLRFIRLQARVDKPIPLIGPLTLHLRYGDHTRLLQVQGHVQAVVEDTN